MANDYTRADYGNRGVSIIEAGKFAGSNLLKLKQQFEAEALWVDMNPMDYAINKNIKPGKEWDGGLNIERQFEVGNGGGGHGGLDLLNGRFVQGDSGMNIAYKANLKHSTMTMEWQNDPYQKAFDGVDKAYSNPKKNQFKYVVPEHKRLMTLMSVTDGTGRLATIQGIEGSSTGLTIVKPFTSMLNFHPLKLDIDSTSMDSVGTIAHLYENLVISLVGPCYDENNDGVAELTPATCIPRFLMLGFREANTADAYQYYDAFRIISVWVTKGYIEVIPGRVAQLSQAGKPQPYHTATEYRDINWCSHSQTSANGLEIAPAWGQPCDPTIAGNAAHTGNISTVGFTAIFNPAVAYTVPALTPATFLFHPGFTMPVQDKMRQCLGLGWDMNTDLGMLNTYWSTGIRALLDNRANTVHGIARPMLPSFLPTAHDMSGGVFTSKGFLEMVTTHALRNGNTGLVTSVIPVNPILYTSLVNQLGDSRIIMSNTEAVLGEGKLPGITITLYDKKYAIVPQNEMPLNYIPILEERSIDMFGGKILDVGVAGAVEFLKLHQTYNERINVTQRHKYVSHELTFMKPRKSAFMFNFTLPV